MTPQLTSVIAERVYELKDRSGGNGNVYLRFGKPRRLPKGPGFYCVYKYEGLGNADRTRYMAGADSVQALQLAMESALVELVCTEAYQEGRLTWHGLPDLGLPVVDAIKDRLRK